MPAIESNIKELLGKTLKFIDGGVGGEEIHFKSECGKAYLMTHRNQECCEVVEVKDICGDMSDLIGSPILQAEEATKDKDSEGFESDFMGSFTWTFYRLATIKGQVVISWLGQSNGYYSEDVDFLEVV